MIRSARVVCATAFAVVVGFELVSQAQSPATVRVSLSSTGEQANGLTTEYALSADGRYVSFIRPPRIWSAAIRTACRTSSSTTA